MSSQFAGRRCILGVLLMMLAMVAAAGDGQIASAERKQVESYGSPMAFERACVRMGGVFVVGAAGELACRLGDGSIVCDHRGNDCWFYPSAPRNARADEAVVLEGGGLPAKEPGNAGSIEVPDGSSSSPGDVEDGLDLGNVAS